jgi:biopolymer transport protein ExbD
MGMTRTAGSPEINVTPLIDVLLVLLIIFLVMLPVLLRSLPVALPASSPDSAPGAPVEIAIDGDLSIAVDGGAAFPNQQLAAHLRPKLARAQAVFVDAADGVPWDRVIAAIATTRGVADELGRTDVTVAVRLRTP